MASGFLILISFFTRIPVGKKVKFNEKDFIKGLNLYTLMGAVIGLFLCAIYIIFNNTYIPFLRGLVLTVAYIVITGGIHLDGAADTSDGIFSGRTGNKIFEIMSDPYIGAFGVITLILILISQFVLFSYSWLSTVFIMPIVGRVSTVMACWKKTYPKDSGMGAVFVENIDSKVLLVNLLTVFIFSIITHNRLVILTASFAALAVSYYISTLIEDKIGGMTGDTCGFITEISQIIFMIVVLFLQG